jgi:hypothetical protein
MSGERKWYTRRRVCSALFWLVAWTYGKVWVVNHLDLGVTNRWAAKKGSSRLYQISLTMSGQNNHSDCSHCKFINTRSFRSVLSCFHPFSQSSRGISQGHWSGATPLPHLHSLTLPPAFSRVHPLFLTEECSVLLPYYEYHSSLSLLHQI